MTSVSRGSDPAHPPANDPIPLLPRGSAVFDNIPIRAIVVEALTGVIGDGTMVVRDGDRGAVILIRGGDVWEVHVVEGDVWRTGTGLLKSIQSWGEASVWAERLDSPLVDLCAALLRGDALYDDLRLMWVNWPSLLSDLGRRGGTYVVEITTPAGRGVTCVTAGRQALSYTDIHPSLGDPALLEAMASNREGSVRVRRVGDEGFAGVQAQAMERAASSPRAAPERAPAVGHPRAETVAGGTAAAQPGPTDPLPGMSWVAPWETTWRPEDEPGGSGNGNSGNGGAGATGSSGAGNGGSAHPAASVPATSTWREFAATTIQAQQGSAPGAPTSADARPAEAGSTTGVGPAAVQGNAGTAAERTSLADVVDDLRSIARRRLQLSAPRVELVLDEGASQRRTVGSVLEEIRGMSIRGVMPATVEAMVDEMAAAASR